MGIKSDVNRLVREKLNSGQLPNADARDPIPADRGVGVRDEGGTGNALASPFTEQTDLGNERVTVKAFDDFDVWPYEAITKITFHDDNGNPLVFKQIDPNTGEVPP
jgi:hypothetical protein